MWVLIYGFHFLNHIEALSLFQDCSEGLLSGTVQNTKICISQEPVHKLLNDRISSILTALHLL